MLLLYDEIVSKLDGTETGLEKIHCATITRLNQEHLNIIYLLILHHFINDPKNNKNDNTKNNTNSDLPYNARTISNGKGILFKKVGQLPMNIQKIIHRYLTIVST